MFVNSLNLIKILFQRTIFGTILKFWLDRTNQEPSLFEIILNSSLEVYSTILRELLPTPAKTHYTFNLRDLSKVFQGLLMFEPEQLKASIMTFNVKIYANLSAYIGFHRIILKVNLIQYLIGKQITLNCMQTP